MLKKFREDDGVAFTEHDYFDIFNFPLIKGNKKSALISPNEALITEKIAKKYFGDADAMGKIIRLDNQN
jgi:putative ABC transport system permease protein